VLVAVFPAADRLTPRSRINFPWDLPPRDRSRTERIADTLADELLRRASWPQGDELHVVHWRLLVEAALRRQAKQTSTGSMATTRAELLLSWALDQGRLTAAARTRADRMSHATLEAPSALPEDVPVTARIWVSHWRDARISVRVRDRRTGEVVAEKVRAVWEARRPGFRPIEWSDDRVVIGRTDRSDTLLALTIEMDEVELATPPGRPAESRRRIFSQDVDIPIRVTAPLAEAYERRADDALGEALLAGLAPPRSPRSVDRVAVPLNAMRARTAARNAGIDTIAVRFELRDDDGVVSESFAWWSDSGGVRGNAIFFGSGHRFGYPFRRSGLRLHIVSDPVVASRHEAASVIWEGEVSIPWPPESNRGQRGRNSTR
jgi:hypothetical protein